MFVVASADPEMLDRWRAGLDNDTSLVEVRRNDALYECLSRLQPELLLVDLRLWRVPRVQDVADLHKASPATRIVAFMETRDEDFELALFRAGVRGICSPDVSGDVLLKIVTAALQGELWIRRALVP